MKSRTKPALRVVPAAQVQLSLPIQGVLRDVKHAFYGLCINAGKQVLAAMMEADRVALCGAKGVPDADRRAVRGGSTRSAGRAGRPAHRRAPAAGTRRAMRASWNCPASRGPPAPTRWTRRRWPPLPRACPCAATPARWSKLPPPEQALSVSKSATSRRFVALSQEQLAQWLSRSLEKLDLPVVMIDGIHFRDRVILVALGIDAQGNKHVLGLREGSTESHARGALAAERSGRARARCRPCAAVGDRRRQGAAQGHRRVLRRHTRSSSAARSTSGAT